MAATTRRSVVDRASDGADEDRREDAELDGGDAIGRALEKAEPSEHEGGAEPGDKDEAGVPQRCGTRRSSSPLRETTFGRASFLTAAVSVIPRTDQ